MYSVNQIAELLNIDTVKVHELLVLHRQQIKSYSSKENGILAIDENGVQYLNDLIGSNQLLTKDDVVISSEQLLVDLDQQVDGFPLNDLQMDNGENVMLKTDIENLKKEISKLDIEIEKHNATIAHYREKIVANKIKFKRVEVKFLRRIVK